MVRAARRQSSGPRLTGSGLRRPEFEDVGDGRTKLIFTDLFHTTEERDSGLTSGVAEGLTESYAALDTLLTTLD